MLSDDKINVNILDFKIYQNLQTVIPFPSPDREVLFLLLVERFPSEQIGK